MYYLIFSLNAVGCEWITVTILSVHNHTSQRADGQQQDQTRKVDQKCTAASNKATGGLPG